MSGNLYHLDIPAETIVEEEEEENENIKNNRKQESSIKCNCDLVLSTFTSAIVMLKEMHTQDLLVAISQNGEVQIWNTAKSLPFI